MYPAIKSTVTPENTSTQLLGSKVKIWTSEGEYEGRVNRVWGDSEKISLAKVIEVRNQKNFFGLQYFYKNEILSIKIVESAGRKLRRKSDQLQGKAASLAPLPFGEIGNREPSDYSDEDDEFTSQKTPIDITDNTNYSKTGDINWNNEDDKGSSLFSGLLHLTFPLPSKYIILDEINSEFQESVNEIKKCSILGVAIEGNINGRFGEIIATNSHVYLFDILSLDKTAFDSGLREILESCAIIKIFHDCRYSSDVLFHLYQVNLGKSTFDTQVGDVIYYMKENHNKLPQYPKFLPECLRYYLKLDTRYLPVMEGKLNINQKVKLWKVRPLLPAYREKAIRSVIFLKELRHAIMEKLLADLTLGINIYLCAVKNASKEELGLGIGAPHLLPPAMSRITSQDMRVLHHNNELDYNQEYDDDIWSLMERVPAQLQVKSECPKDTQKKVVLENDKAEDQKDLGVDFENRCDKTEEEISIPPLEDFSNFNGHHSNDGTDSRKLLNDDDVVSKRDIKSDMERSLDAIRLKERTLNKSSHKIGFIPSGRILK